MEKLHQQALKRLLNKRADYSVTMYVPIHMSASPPHMNENQIRLKNLTQKAIDELQARRNYELAQKLEQELIRLHDNLSFWKDQTPGLLICATAERIEMYHLPVDTEEYVAVDDHFHLAPLFGLLSDEHPFYVLELAEHNPQLLKGDFYGLEPTELRLPANISEAVRQNSDRANHHTAEIGLSSGYPGRFFKIIDGLVYESTDHRLPLILAGIDTETAEYRHLSRYPKILKTTITSNSLRMPPHKLYATAKEIIKQELIEPEHRSVVEEYSRLVESRPEIVASDEATITRAAEQGRIDKLLTSMSLETTDTVQDSNQPSTRITFLEPRLNSLLNNLAPKVWQTRGRVLNLRPNEMPGRTPLLAKLRY